VCAGACLERGAGAGEDGARAVARVVRCRCGECRGTARDTGHQM